MIKNCLFDKANFSLKLLQKFNNRKELYKHHISFLPKDVDTLSITSPAQRCISALKGNNPKEIAFLIDLKTGKPLRMFEGDAKSCLIDLGSIDCNSVKLIHGHPALDNSGITLPVSLQDFLVLNTNNKIKNITAYNIKGKQSYLEKNNDYVQLGSRDLIALKNRYANFLLNNSSDTKKIEKLIQYCKTHKNSFSIKHEISKQLTELQNNKDAAVIIDNFWKENAKELHLKYFSNF